MKLLKINNLLRYNPFQKMKNKSLYSKLLNIFTYKASKCNHLMGILEMNNDKKIKRFHLT